jgi:hypothetical protein
MSSSNGQTKAHASPDVQKQIQNSNGKGQMANGKPFETCPLPFAI